MIIGQRVSYSGELCTIRYIGPVDGTKGEWLGVEWDDATRGKHDGEAGGKRYFTCQSKELKAASFIRPNRPADKERTFLEALRFKYDSEHIKIIQIGQPPPPKDKPIRISGKEAEEVGFDKISKRLADLHELKIVLLDGLCISNPLNDDVLQAWETPPTNKRHSLGTEISDICPKITELDLSRNLFTSLHEVAVICEQLEHLKILRLDGNRFQDTKITEGQAAHFRLIFAKVENLSLDANLLSWADIVNICSCFPTLKTLSIGENEFTELDDAVSLGEYFPEITEIKLESNKFTSLSDLLPLARIPSLRSLVLKYGQISSVDPARMPSGFENVPHLDVSFNAISSWDFINDLTPIFPSLTSLRISNNPLYSSLHSPAGKELTADDGYMLTIARLPKLKILNFSNITEKDRLNAETYYLSLIVQELSLAPEEEAARIKERHPRWKELCEEYGEPTVRREGQHIDPRSLAARLLTLELELSPEAAGIFGLPQGTTRTIKNVPKRFNIYSVLGMVAKAFGQRSVVPGLRLVVVTDEWEEREDGKRERRYVRCVPETRGIGTFVESWMGRVRVEWEEPLRMDTPETSSAMVTTLSKPKPVIW